MWGADFKQKILPKTHSGRVKYIFTNPAENCSHEAGKLLLGLRENQRTVYFQKFYRLKFILWSRKMPIWQVCWEFFGKSLKLSLPNSKNDLNYLFYAKFVP